MQKLSLQQRLLQKLSPQQIQIIKLLEIPTMELESRIKRELEENPVLNAKESFTDEERATISRLAKKGDNDSDYTDNVPSYRLHSNNYSSNDKIVDIQLTRGESFLDILKGQIAISDFKSDKERALAEYIAGNIDEDGYLRRDIESIADDLSFSVGIEVEDSEVKSALKKIQQFDPPGVGARDLKESLFLQLERKIEQDSSSSLELALSIVNKAFEPFIMKHYDKIGKIVNAPSNEVLKEAIDEIIRLNPKPGGALGYSEYDSGNLVIPDFIVDNVDGKLVLNLNQVGVPELSLDGSYSAMLEDLKETKKRSKEQKETLHFMRQKMDSAKWFIEAIKQRQQTLMLVMGEILTFQYDYFFEGDTSKLRPMILRDIADKTEMDISTISRVTSSKYVQTNFGIFSLKSLFTEGIAVNGDEEISNAEIKRVLKEYIDAENKSKPLTDDKLSELLKKHSYGIARRTVAKYREQMNIPVARLRKRL